MSETLRGILAMTAAMAAFCVGDTLFKVLGSRLPVGEMLFIRGVISSALMIAYVTWTGQIATWRRLATPLVGLRLVCEVACSALFFLALMSMAFADAAAIGQFTPLAVMAGAALFLGEPVGWRRWTAAGIGFIGVLMIVKPGSSAFQPMSLVMLASMIAVAGRDLVTRRLPRDMSSPMLTMSSAVAMTVLGVAMAPFERTWLMPTSGELAILTVCACTIVIGLFSIIVAMRRGDTASVTPFRYAYMVFAMLSSIVVFGDWPDYPSWVGIVMIVASGLYMLHREQVVRRAASPVQSAPGRAS